MAIIIDSNRAGSYEVSVEATDLLNGANIAYSALTTPAGFPATVRAYSGAGAWVSKFGNGDLIYARDTGRTWIVLLSSVPAAALVLISEGSPNARTLSTLMFGAATAVVGARTLDPGGPARASSAGAPANANPALLAPLAGRAATITARRTNNTVGATCPCTLFVNNVATLLTVTIPSAAFSASATIAVPVTWTAGQSLAVQAVSAGATSNNVVVTILAEMQL